MSTGDQVDEIIKNVTGTDVNQPAQQQPVQTMGDLLDLGLDTAPVKKPNIMEEVKELSDLLGTSSP